MECFLYSKTLCKRTDIKKTENDRLSLNAGQKYCRMLPLKLNAGQKYCKMLQGEHSAMLSTFIKLPFVIKNFVLSIFEWPFYTDFTIDISIYMYCTFVPQRNCLSFKGTFLVFSATYIVDWDVKHQHYKQSTN